MGQQAPASAAATTMPPTAIVIVDAVASVVFVDDYVVWLSHDRNPYYLDYFGLCISIHDGDG